jgi:hypothetical protein
MQLGFRGKSRDHVFRIKSEQCHELLASFGERAAAL